MRPNREHRDHRASTIQRDHNRRRSSDLTDRVLQLRSRIEHHRSTISPTSEQGKSSIAGASPGGSPKENYLPAWPTLLPYIPTLPWRGLRENWQRRSTSPTPLGVIAPRQGLRRLCTVLRTSCHAKRALLPNLASKKKADARSLFPRNDCVKKSPAIVNTIIRSSA